MGNESMRQPMKSGTEARDIRVGGRQLAAESVATTEGERSNLDLGRVAGQGPEQTARPGVLTYSMTAGHADEPAADRHAALFAGAAGARANSQGAPITVPLNQRYYEGQGRFEQRRRRGGR
jgi:hypothetical protein